MAASQQLIWIVLLAASVLLCADGAVARITRRDPRVTVVAGGFVGLACLLLAAICSSTGR